MKYYELLIGIAAFVVAHILTFFQLNGQFFKIDWFRKNEIWVAAAGIILSFFYIWGTKYTVGAFDGLLWPARFIGFGIGMIVYALGLWIFFKEGISPKTLISLILCVILISIQVLWKTNDKENNNNIIIPVEKKV